MNIKNSKNTSGTGYYFHNIEHKAISETFHFKLFLVVADSLKTHVNFKGMNTDFNVLNSITPKYHALD